jgi:hypothetical protein
MPGAQTKKGRWRFYFILAATIAMAALIFFCPNRSNPQFLTGSRPKEQSYRLLRYPFFDPIPISKGLTWVSALPATNSARIWLLNVDSGQVEGEFVNVEPLFIDGGGKIAVGRALRNPDNRFKKALDEWLSRLSTGSIRLVTHDEYWLIELTTGKTSLIGVVPATRQASYAIPSPNLKRAYLLYASTLPNEEYLILDDSSKSLRIQALPGQVIGWWNDNQIVSKSISGDFELYDLDKKTSTPFLSWEFLSEWLAKNQIDPSWKAGIFQSWDGREYRFYLTDLLKKHYGVTCYLAEVQKGGADLKLLNRKFQFQTMYLDGTGRGYADSGDDIPENDGALFVRDLRTGIEKTIVPDGGRYFSFPNFYGDPFVFVRSNMIWKTDVRGSNLVRLFPPVPGRR